MRVGVSVSVSVSELGSSFDRVFATDPLRSEDGFRRVEG